VRGYTGKEDPSRKQVTLSLSVAADGALPAWYQVGDGNAADTQTYLRHLTAVQEYLDVQQPLVVGDSKLISGPNILGFCRARARFLGPTSLKPADRTRLRQLWAAGSRCTGWISRRQTSRPGRGGTGRWSAPKTGRTRCGRPPTACAACSSRVWTTAAPPGTNGPRTSPAPAARWG
jgi:Transposase